MNRKKLPIGIQTFREIREDNCYYVDKTPHAWRMVESGKYYFLSRPRRFGKSLFLDTLAELFEGNEPLFRGLFIHDKWDWSVRYPVIRISFGGGKLTSIEAFQDKLEEIFRINAETLDISCDYAFSDRRCFAQMIRRAFQKTAKRVVVLVDEYDKPILDNITDRTLARQIRDRLHDLYSVIKDSDAHIKFAFLTGVSKFSKVSIFSGLNNLNDITLDLRFSDICGYTNRDIDTIFAPEITDLDRTQIRHWYDGYSWLGEHVYNPFDFLLFLDKRDYRPYWFETGTPTFLIDLLMERGVFAPNLGKLLTNADLLGSFDVDAIETEALLFQTGYLTIKSVRNIPGMQQIVLGYPNIEVQTSLNRHLCRTLIQDNQVHSRLMLQLYDALLADDMPGMRTVFETLFASLPHDWHRNTPIARYEGFYASVFYTFFAGLGIEVIPEDTTNKGRIDMSVRHNGRVYLFEFKVVEEHPEGKAILQLQQKDYAAKYRGQGEPIRLIGVEFSKQARNIVAFDVQDVEP